MKKILISVFFISSFIVLFNNKAISDVRNYNKDFESYKERFVLKLWKTDPLWASSVGYHVYDSVLIVPTYASRKTTIAFCTENLDSLSSFPYNKLTSSNKVDYSLLRNQLRYMIWCITDLKQWQWDPSYYNVSGTFADMLTNNYDKLETRLHNFYLRMAFVPAYYEAAKENIKNPTKEHTQLAIDQNTGGIGVFENDLEDALKKSKLTAAQKEKVRTRAKETVVAIKGYTSWLETLQNDHPKSFRLGKELYEQKFAFELQSSYSSSDIYKKAVKRKEELHNDMYLLSKTLWFKYFGHLPMPKDKMETIRQMLNKLSNNHVQKDAFQATIEHQIPELIAFINKHKLLYIDPSKPLEVRLEPSYMAGVAGASISSPGPYDKNGKTYYNVGSLAGWSKEKAESYLREYNHYILQILSIHEAIPGHYTQGVYANNATSIVKSILGNNAMIEGWAVYGERMMLENGYDGDKGINSTEASPEMWLMYDKWHLRSICNTILDYSVHTQNMKKEAAMNLLMKEAFQEKTEAEGKWKRVCVTSVQLCCYFTGYTEIYDLRSKLMDKEGNEFNLKEFHEKFLSYGSAPVKFIKEMILK